MSGGDSRGGQTSTASPPRVDMTQKKAEPDSLFLPLDNTAKITHILDTLAKLCP